MAPHRAICERAGSATYAPTALPPIRCFFVRRYLLRGADLTITDSGGLPSTTPSTADAYYLLPGLHVSRVRCLFRRLSKPLPSPQAGSPAGVVSATYAIQPVYAIDFIQGFALAQGPMQFNGSTDLDDSALQLTNGGKTRLAALFLPAGEYSVVITDFTFQLSTPSADGITFTIQGGRPRSAPAEGSDTRASPTA